MGQCMPSGEEVKKLLKQLCSSALGMCAALAMATALRATFQDAMGDAGIVVYALIVSWLSVFMTGVILKDIKPRCAQHGGEKAQALADLFKVAFCLMSAYAWRDVFELTGSVWIIFGIALALTVALVILIIIAYKLYDCHPENKCPGPAASNCGLACCCVRHTYGLVMWTPITFGLVTGMVWNLFFSSLIKSADLGDSAIVVAFVYALLTIPLAIVIILYTTRVREKGWGCFSCQCPGPAGQPCCTLENKIAEPLESMFKGEASAIMAFAWNDAFVAIWADTELSGSPADQDDPDPPNIGWIILYVMVAVIFGILAVLGVKKCTS